MSAARFPVEPLERIVNVRVHEGDSTGGAYSTPMGRHLAAAGYRPGTIRQWRHKGGIPIVAADRLAIHLGEHPSAIWPDWWDL